MWPPNTTALTQPAGGVTTALAGTEAPAGHVPELNSVEETQLCLSLLIEAEFRATLHLFIYSCNIHRVGSAVCSGGEGQGRCLAA